APAWRVWRHLVESDRLSSWFGGPVAIDPRPGGVVTVGDDGRGERRGTVEEIRTARRLVVRLWSRPRGTAGALHGTRIELDLRPVAGGTELTVVESRLASGHLGTDRI